MGEQAAAPDQNPRPCLSKERRDKDGASVSLQWGMPTFVDSTFVDFTLSHGDVRVE